MKMAGLCSAQRGLLALGALALCLSATAAGAGPARSARQDVLAVESARLEAEVAHDMPRLEKLTGTDMWYIHASGLTQDRAAYLAFIAGATSPVRNAILHDQSVTVVGPVAYTHGTVDYILSDPRPRTARYTAVYRLGRTGWQIVSWHNSPVVVPAPVAPAAKP